MENQEAEVNRIALAAADAFRSEAGQGVVLTLGDARILLTKGQRIHISDPFESDVVPDYPAVETSLTDDSASWLS
jgi:hypothetical protein